MNEVDMSDKYLIFYTHEDVGDESSLVAVLSDCTDEEAKEYCRERLVKEVREENEHRERRRYPPVDENEISFYRFGAEVDDDGLMCCYFQKGLER